MMHRSPSSRRSFQAALIIALGLVLGASAPAEAQQLSKIFYGFEGDQSAFARFLEGVSFQGDAGVEVGLGHAYMGQNNVRLGSAPSWNAVTKNVGMVPAAATWCNFGFVLKGSGNGAPFSVPPVVARIFDTQTGQVYYEQVVNVGVYANAYTQIGTFNNWVMNAPGRGGDGQLPLDRGLSVQLGYIGDGFGSWVRIDNLIWWCFA
jgi:hypothetical protein